MALKKPTFEQEPTAQAQGATQTAEAPAAAASTPAAVSQPAAAAEATVAIASAGATSLAVVGNAAERTKIFKKELDSMRGASDFRYGNYAVYKGINGEVMSNDTANASMGRWVKVRLLSWDDHYEVSPGESGDSTKDYVAYSKDGKTVDSVLGSELQEWVGKSVDEYTTFLRDEEDFKLTKCRRFIDTACAVLGADKGSAPIGKVVQITLSETSIPSFASYQQQLQDNARCVEMGLAGFTLPDDPFSFFFLRESAQKGKNNWTKLRVLATLPAEI